MTTGRRPPGTSGVDGRIGWQEEAEVVDRLADDVGSAAAHPAVDDAAVVVAEVDVVGHAIPPLQALQRRRCPYIPPLTRAPNTRCGAAVPWSVPRPSLLQLVRPNSENVMTSPGSPRPGSSTSKNRFTAALSSAMRVGVHRRFVGVAVEVTPPGGEHAEPEVGVDQPGHHLEPRRRLGLRQCVGDDRAQRPGHIELIDDRLADRGPSTSWRSVR